jgi:CheY-like chemotaxis protein
VRDANQNDVTDPQDGNTQTHDDMNKPVDTETSEDSTAKTVQHIPRILIVEDDLELGQMIQSVLAKMEALVFRETHGQKALNIYNKIRPDLVLLDIGLPDMTGWQVLDALKELKSMTRRPKIVVLTTYGDPANRLMGKLQGVDGYLIKPLQKVVREILGIKPK